jgi:hypothetical protein
MDKHSIEKSYIKLRQETIMCTVFYIEKQLVILRFIWIYIGLIIVMQNWKENVSGGHEEWENKPLRMNPRVGIQNN